MPIPPLEDELLAPLAKSTSRDDDEEVVGLGGSAGETRSACFMG